MAMDTEGRSPIYSYILGKPKYQYFIDKVKRPLHKNLVKCVASSKGNRLLEHLRLLWYVWCIVRSVRRYPEPTKGNVKKRMSFILLDTFEEFEKYNKVKPPLFSAVKRIATCECEHDVDQSQRLTWFLSKLAKRYASGEWPQLEDWSPMNGWRDLAVIKAVELASAEFKAHLTVGGRKIADIEM